VGLINIKLLHEIFHVRDFLFFIGKNMNWFTKENVAHLALEKKHILIGENDCCDHVNNDHSLLHRVSYENDSFGKEGYGVCKDCAEKHDLEEGGKKVICKDCKTEVAVKDTITWKWYDFYAAQGDIPLIICRECTNKGTHLRRVQRDREDQDEEFGVCNEDDDNTDW
jgi:hypothetical protein